MSPIKWRCIQLCISNYIYDSCQCTLDKFVNSHVQVLLIIIIYKNFKYFQFFFLSLSSRYNKIQDNAGKFKNLNLTEVIFKIFFFKDSIWKFERYKLVYEYKGSTFLPAPFSIMVHLISPIYYLIKRNKKQESINIDCNF